MVKKLVIIFLGAFTAVSLGLTVRTGLPLPEKLSDRKFLEDRDLGTEVDEEYDGA